MSPRALCSGPLIAGAKWLATLGVVLLHNGCITCDDKSCGGAIDPTWTASLEPMPNPEVEVTGCVGSECWTSVLRPSLSGFEYCAAEEGSRLGCSVSPNGDRWTIVIQLRTESVPPVAAVGTKLTVIALETTTSEVLLDEEAIVPKRTREYACGCH